MRLESLMRIDRRIVFLLMGIAILLPLILRMRPPIGVQPPTRRLFETVDAIDPAKQCLMISTDYAPQTEAECQPMTVALIRHAFARRIRVLVLSLYVEATGLAADALTRTMAEFNEHAASPADSIVYGRDCVFLGWQPPPIVPIIAMGTSITGIYPTDFYGKPTPSMPVMQGIQNYDDVGIVCAITAIESPLWFVQIAQTKWGVKVGAGCTAVSAPNFYPYLQTGQFSGLMGGMKGAAEYEELVEDAFHRGGRRRATEGMGAQSTAHVLIMAFVILGNVAYLAAKGRRA